MTQPPARESYGLYIMLAPIQGVRGLLASTASDVAGRPEAAQPRVLGRRGFDVLVPELVEKLSRSLSVDRRPGRAEEGCPHLPGWPLGCPEGRCSAEAVELEVAGRLGALGPTSMRSQCCSAGPAALRAFFF